MDLYKFLEFFFYSRNLDKRIKSPYRNLVEMVLVDVHKHLDHVFVENPGSKLAHQFLELRIRDSLPIH